MPGQESKPGPLKMASNHWIKVRTRTEKAAKAIFSRDGMNHERQTLTEKE